MKLSKYIPIVLLSCVFAGCGDSLLNREDPSSLNYDKFYKTEADFQAALTGAYLKTVSQTGTLMAVNEATTDNSFVHPFNNTSDVAMFDFLTVPSSLPGIRTFWANAYSSITYCNMVLTRIPNSPVAEASKKVFASEAKFLRALTYFNLVRICGGVPLYEKEITDLAIVYDRGRASVEDTYNFIIKDLTEAENIDSERTAAQMAKSGNKATTLAVKALLGKVYLYKKEYTNAATKLQEVVSAGKYRLYENLADVYNPDTPINNEVLFCFNYERVGGQSCPLTFQSLPKASRGLLPLVTGDNGNGDYNVEPNTLYQFATNDKRRALFDSLVMKVGADDVNFIYTKKYMDMKANSSGSSSDFIVIRYADVLLTLADALNQSGNTAGAYQHINQVRQRAGLDDLTPGLSKEQMNRAIERERHFEFIMEGDRWFDLCQRGTPYLKTTLNNFFPTSNTPDAKVDDYKALFPLPSDQVSLKPGVLIQNDGY